MAINTNDVQQNRTFNPNEHLMQIKSGQSSKDYLPVQWRLVWFRSAFPHGTIETEMIHLDLDRETEEEVFVWNNEKRRSEKVVKRAKGFVVFKATVRDGEGGIATGTKTEKAASFPDYIEKAETGSIGRALAALGYGTQFTGDEWSESHRIVDSPADITRSNGTATSSNAAASTANDKITEQQLNSIRKLSERLGKPEPEGVTQFASVDACKMIQTLTAEYHEQKSAKSDTSTSNHQNDNASISRSEPNLSGQAPQQATLQTESASTPDDSLTAIPTQSQVEKLAKFLYPSHTFERVVNHYLKLEAFDELTPGQCGTLYAMLLQYAAKKGVDVKQAVAA